MSAFTGTLMLGIALLGSLLGLGSPSETTAPAVGAVQGTFCSAVGPASLPGRELAPAKVRNGLPY